jgi:hypothetical protein
MARRRRRYYDPLAPLSPGMIQALIHQIVNGSLKPARNEIRRQRMDARQLMHEDIDRERGGSQGLAEILGDVPDQIKNDYNQASGASAAFGKGFSDTLRQGHDQDAAASAELLRRIGAPESQVQQVGNVGASGADTTYALGGQIPADLLNTQGAAFTAAARQQPGFVLATSRAEQAKIRKGERDKERDLDQMLSDLMDKVPGLSMDAYKELVGIELQKEASRTNRSYLGIAGEKQTFDERATLADLLGYDPVTGEQTSDAKAAKGKNAGKARENRNSALDSLRKSVFSAAQQVAKGTKVDDPSSLKGFKIVMPTYQQAYNQLYNQYAKPLERLAPAGGRPWWMRQLKARIDAALAQYGIKPAPKKAKPPWSKVRPG